MTSRSWWRRIYAVVTPGDGNHDMQPPDEREKPGTCWKLKQWSYGMRREVPVDRHGPLQSGADVLFRLDYPSDGGGFTVTISWWQGRGSMKDC